MRVLLFTIFTLFVLASCDKKKETVVTPWGTTLNADGGDSVAVDSSFSLNDIISNGELIMLTLTGPETYYDYHGHGMGEEYMLCEKFAQHIGVSLRVEVCKDTTDLLKRLNNNDGDIVAFPLPKKKISNALRSKIIFCGAGVAAQSTQWAVNKENKDLAESLDKWFNPAMIAKVKQEETFLLSTRSITRHIYSPMLSRSKGIISRYDRYFQIYASVARIDWRLMAAQCYQESCFDPNAHSWAGARGLMQIMPATASYLGLPSSMIHDPESNIAASAKYMQELMGKFGDVQDPSQRCFFALACYNGGYNHIRDAMSLVRKYGGNPYNWGDVSRYVLKLSSPAFYNDPVVRHGYMRGSETVDYVERIRQRWMQYRGVGHGGFSPIGSAGSGAVPARANHKYRFKI